MKESTIQKVISEQLELGNNRDEVIVFLFSNHPLSLNQAKSQVAKYMKANNLVTVRVGFKKQYADYLVETQPTKDEAIAYVKSEGSDNVVKHLSNYVLMWELSTAAFAAGKAAK